MRRWAFFLIVIILACGQARERATPKQPAVTVTETPLPIPTETPLPIPTETPLPIPTETPLPVPTETPLPVPTESIAPAGTANLVIVTVEKREEYVDIQNPTGEAVDLAGWRLLSVKGAQDCKLGGFIEPGATLRIWAMSGDAGKGGFNCGFDSNIWNNSEPDAAVLYDPGGAEVSRRE